MRYSTTLLIEHPDNSISHAMKDPAPLDILLSGGAPFCVAVIKKSARVTWRSLYVQWFP